MLRILLVFSFVVFAVPSRADTVCALIYDLDKSEFLLNEGRCDTLISPASTFKIPLSLMGYDSGYLMSSELPELPYRADYLATLSSHQHETSPAYWIKNSVVWYSQLFTEWLGTERLLRYLDVFDYGNKDVSGDEGKNNGLTRAWLSSSLKITPMGQLVFIRKLINHELPVKEHAYSYTVRLLKQEDTINHYEIYGKTGTVVSPIDENGLRLNDRQFGWFIGWVQKDGRRFIFVNLISQEKQEGVFSGAVSKADIMNRLANLLPDT